MSLSNPNKPVTEERLSEFYQSILPYLGGMPEAVCNKFDKANLYSTIEKIVGCWIDGRPIYQKTVDLGSLTNTGNTQTSKHVELGASVNEYIDYQILCNVESGANIVWQGGVSYVSDKGDSAITPSLNTNHTSDSSLKNKVGVTYLGNLSWVNNIKMTLRYTKTTDAANSFNYADENDYSTTEHIVGSWIDGKPVYQKTFSFTSQDSVNTGKTVDIGASVDSVVSYKAYLKGSGSAWIDVVCCVNQVDDKVAARVLVYDNNNVTPNKIGLTFTSTTPSSWLNRPVYVTLQYTKTTD